MTALSDAVEEELDRLEEDAEEIEDLYTEFFNRIGTHSSGSSGSMVTVPGEFWDTPSDELEELQREALRNYEVWYNSATPLIADYLPNRQDDFEEHIGNSKRGYSLTKGHAQIFRKC